MGEITALNTMATGTEDSPSNYYELIVRLFFPCHMQNGLTSPENKYA